VRRWDLYLLKTLVRPFLVILISLVGIFTIADFVEKIDRFVDAGVPPKVVLLFYLYMQPYFIDTALPMSLLLATVFTIGTLNKRFEIAACRAAGMSLWQTTRALLILGILAVTFQFLFENFVVTPANHRYKEIMRRVVRQEKEPVHYREILRQDLNGNILLFKTYDAQKKKGTGVTLLQAQDSGLSRRWDLEELFWVDSLQQWKYSTGVLRTFSSAGQLSFQQLPGDTILPMTLTPDDLARKPIRPDEMNIFQLKRFIERKQLLGLDPRRWIVNYHFKLAFLLTSFITILWGIPLALKGTRTSLSSAVGKSILLLFTYYLLLIGGKKIGYNADSYPACYVWFGDIFLGITGLWRFWREAEE